MSIKDNYVKLRDATHVIIKTGYAPDLGKVMQIENLVGCDCLFSCAGLSNLGCLIPSPFGFYQSKFSLPAKFGHDQFVDVIRQMMKAVRKRPFYDLGTTILRSNVSHLSSDRSL